MKIKMNDLMDLWGEDLPAESVNAEKITREVLRKAKKGTRPRRTLLVAVIAAAVALAGGTVAAASTGKLHFEKISGYQLRYDGMDEEKDTVVVMEEYDTSFDALIRIESEEPEAADNMEGSTVAMRVGYLPHALTLRSTAVTLKELLELHKDTTCTVPASRQQELYIEINDVYAADALSEKEAARAASRIGSLAGGYDEETLRKAAEAILAFRQAQQAGVGTNESDAAYAARMAPYVEAVMALPGLTAETEDAVFAAIGETETYSYSIHIYAKPDAESKDFLIPGDHAELVWEKELNGMEAMLVAAQEGQSLLLYDADKGCVVVISGTMGEDELLKVAENIELVETDAPAYSRVEFDWCYVAPSLG